KIGEEFKEFQEKSKFFDYGKKIEQTRKVVDELKEIGIQYELEFHPSVEEEGDIEGWKKRAKMNQERVEELIRKIKEITNEIQGIVEDKNQVELITPEIQNPEDQIRQI